MAVSIIDAANAMGSPEECAREVVTERIKHSAKRISGHIRLLRKFWRYYLTSTEGRGQRRDNDRDPGSAEWRADLFVPASFSVIETAVPRAVFALFGATPYVRPRGRERSDFDAEHAVQAMLQYDFEQDRLITKAIDFFKSFYIFGTAVGRIDYWRDFYELERPPTYTIDMDVDDSGAIIDAKPRRLPNKERVMRYDGPRFTNVALPDFYPDPMFADIRRFRWCGEREESTVDRLRDENRQYRKLTGRNLYTNLDDIRPYHAGLRDMADLEDFRLDTAEVMRFDYGLGSGVKQYLDDEPDAVVLHHYWEPDRYVVMANGHTIIRNGKNPYNDKRLPYVAAPCFPTLQEFYGQGLLAPIQWLQEELNSLRNLALDEGKLNIQGVWAVSDDTTFSDVDMAVYPGKVWQTEFQGGKPGVARVFESQLASDFERLEDRTQRDIQSTLAINDYMIGAGGGSAGTASEAAMLNASAANRFRLQALIAQERFVVELADMFLSRRQQFLDRRRTFRILGEQGYHYPEIGPDEIHGHFDFEPQGSQSQPNKEVMRQQMIQIISTAGANPTLMQMTNWYEVYRELWSTFDFRFTDRFINAPPTKQLTQQQENYILLMGEKVAVEPTEDHQAHMQALMEIMPDAADNPDERVRAAVQDHVDQHGQYLKAAGGPTSPAQTPGLGPGAPGNAPGTGNQQVPTMPALQAQVMGGPGGPIA